MLPEALTYHLRVRDHFKRHPSIWEFFAAAQTREEQLASFQTELLKNTYQFRPETDAGLYAQIDQAREKLGLGGLPVTAYQAQYANEYELNAGIVYLHQQAHLVFSGPIRQRLNEAEQLAVIAHELSHVRLYTLAGGDLEIADRIITAIGNHAVERASEPVYQETARLFRLYTEIYCDRGAYTVLGDSGPVITGLLKIATGLPEVNAASYLQQAEAIFTASPGTQAATPTHPENYIRTRAIRLWQDQGEAAEAAVTKMIEGLTDLDRLDLFAQSALHGLTREVLLDLLRPEWVRTAVVLGLAHRYFPGLSWTDAGEPDWQERLNTTLDAAQPSVREYFSYLLLDFALADPSLDNQLTGRALVFAENSRLSDVFEPLCKKELQLNEKKWQQYKRSALAAYQEIKSE